MAVRVTTIVVLIVTVCFTSCLAVGAKNEEEEEVIIVTTPRLGAVKGRVKETVGNLGQPAKTFYNFQNLPFAESVVGDKRFSVSKSEQLQRYTLLLSAVLMIMMD